MLFKFTNGKTVDLNNESGACKMVVREEFDEFFFNYVVGKGVEFVRGKVLKIDENRITEIVRNISLNFAISYQKSMLVGPTLMISEKKNSRNFTEP